MKQPPRDPMEGILVARDWQAVTAYSIIITVSIFSVFFYCRDYLLLDSKACNNVVFIALALAQLWHVFDLPSADVSFFKNEITTSRYVWGGLLICLLIMVTTYFIVPVRHVLSVGELNGQLLLAITVASLLPVIFIQLLKRLKMIS
jgi:Ca2+-transporting ATPase